jgi:hypothetical protein
VAAADDIRAMLVEHDRYWSELDLDRLSELWDTDDPHALYMGDEYRDPVIGKESLERHWARLGSRLGQARMASDPAVINLLSDDLAHVMLDLRWSFTGVEGGDPRNGRSWVSAVLRRTAAGWRFVSYMERLTTLSDD